MLPCKFVTKRKQEDSYIFQLHCISGTRQKEIKSIDSFCCICTYLLYLGEIICCFLRSLYIFLVCDKSFENY